jgi:hypothetical protein
MVVCVGSDINQTMHGGRLNLNATFSFLLDKFEKRNWEFNMKLMKKQNWEDFATIVNIHFPSDVQCT